MGGLVKGIFGGGRRAEPQIVYQPAPYTGPSAAQIRAESEAKAAKAEAERLAAEKKTREEADAAAAASATAKTPRRRAVSLLAQAGGGQITTAPNATGNLG